MHKVLILFFVLVGQQGLAAGPERPERGEVLLQELEKSVPKVVPAQSKSKRGVRREALAEKKRQDLLQNVRFQAPIRSDDESDEANALALSQSRAPCDSYEKEATKKHFLDLLKKDPAKFSAFLVRLNKLTAYKVAHHLEGMKSTKDQSNPVKTLEEAATQIQNTIKDGDKKLSQDLTQLFKNSNSDWESFSKKKFRYIALKKNASTADRMMNDEALLYLRVIQNRQRFDSSGKPRTFSASDPARKMVLEDSDLAGIWAQEELRKIAQNSHQDEFKIGSASGNLLNFSTQVRCVLNNVSGCQDSKKDEEALLAVIQDVLKDSSASLACMKALLNDVPICLADKFRTDLVDLRREMADIVAKDQDFRKLAAGITDERMKDAFGWVQGAPATSQKKEVNEQKNNKSPKVTKTSPTVSPSGKNSTPIALSVENVAPAQSIPAAKEQLKEPLTVQTAPLVSTPAIVWTENGKAIPKLTSDEFQQKYLEKVEKCRKDLQSGASTESSLMVKSIQQSGSTVSQTCVIDEGSSLQVGKCHLVSMPNPRPYYKLADQKTLELDRVEIGGLVLETLGQTKADCPKDFSFNQNNKLCFKQLKPASWSKSEWEDKGIRSLTAEFDICQAN